MRILISNDDGIDAEGIKALSAALASLGEVWVVAPEKERSAQSHALTLHKPLRVKPRGPRAFAVSGTPADCIYLATQMLMPEPPDLVVSGINRGGNIGKDVHYSGTVAAAREAAMAGIAAVAVSLFLGPDADDLHYDSAAAVAKQVAQALSHHGLERGAMLNVNVPNRPLAQVRGLRVARLGHRIYADGVTTRKDPWNRPYHWIGGAQVRIEAEPDTDGGLLMQGFATLTPLATDPTCYAAMDALQTWFEQPRQS